MTLEVNRLSIEITDDENHNSISIKWVDDGVAEMCLSDDFYIDENTINELTTIIMAAFKELMK